MSKELRIYKPGNSGSAVKFQTRVDKKNYDELMMFGEFANQTGKDESGNARFDWKGENNPGSKAVVFKFSELDVAKLLLVLRGEVEKFEIFHDPNKSYDDSDGVKRNNVLKIARGDKGYLLNISKKEGEELRKVNIAVSWEEGILLQAFCDNFLQRFYA